MRYLILFLYSSVLFSEITPIQFKNWLTSYQENALQIPSAAKQIDRKIQYVFVCGFLNEMNNCYFEKNIKELVDCGVPRENIHVKRLQSTLSIEGNESRLYEELAQISGEIVLIAHSYAGPVTVELSVKRKDYFAKNVIAAFVIQGVFGGSSLADMASSLVKWLPVPTYMPQSKYLIPVANYLRERAAQFTKKASSGLNSLTTTDASVLQDLLENDEEWMSRISPKFYFIRSKVGVRDTKNYQYILTKGLRALSFDLEDNDGAVSVDNQKINGVGCALVLIDGVDHSGLTSHKTGPDYIKPLMRSIFSGVDFLL